MIPVVRSLPGMSVSDRELFILSSFDRQPVGRQVRDMAEGGSFFHDGDEPFEIRPFAFSVDLDAPVAAFVAHEPGDAACGFRGLEGEIPEPHTLNAARDPHRDPVKHRLALFGPPARGGDG